MIALDVTPLAVQGHGGVARLVRALLQGWSAPPAAPPLMLLTPSSLPASDAALGHEVCVLPAGSPRAFRRRVSVALRRGDIDVLLSPWQAFPRGSASTVVWVHEVAALHAGAVEGHVRAWVQRRWLRRNARECAALLVPTETVRRDVLLLEPGAANRVHVVRPGLDVGAWQQWMPTSRDPRHVLMVGVGPGRRRARKKGLDVALAARRDPAWPGVPLVLVGRPGLRVPGDVEVHAAPDDPALAALYAQAHALIVPSRSEGFGYPVVEALACGTAVVATEAGSLPEVGGDAVRLVASGDPAALARAVSDLVGDPTPRVRHARPTAWPPAIQTPVALASQVQAICAQVREAAACGA